MGKKPSLDEIFNAPTSAPAPAGKKPSLDDIFAGAATTPQAQPEYGGRFSGLGDFVGKTARAIDKFSGAASTRAAVGSLVDGGGVRQAASDAFHTYGTGDKEAPTGKEIATKAGLRDTINSSRFPFSPAGIVGFGLDVGLDPLNALGFAPKALSFGGRKLVKGAANVAAKGADTLSDAARSGAIAFSEKHLRPTPAFGAKLGKEGVKDAATIALDSGAIKAGAKAESTAAALRNLKEEIGAGLGDIIDASKAEIDPKLVADRLRKEVLAPLEATSATKSEAARIRNVIQDFEEKFLPANPKGREFGAPTTITRRMEYKRNPVQQGGGMVKTGEIRTPIVELQVVDTPIGQTPTTITRKSQFVPQKPKPPTTPFDKGMFDIETPQKIDFGVGEPVDVIGTQNAYKTPPTQPAGPAFKSENGLPFKEIIEKRIEGGPQMGKEMRIFHMGEDVKPVHSYVSPSQKASLEPVFVEKRLEGVANKTPLRLSQTEAEKQIWQGRAKYDLSSGSRQSPLNKAYKGIGNVFQTAGEAADQTPEFLAAKSAFGPATNAAKMAERTAGLTNGGLLSHLTDVGIGSGLMSAAAAHPLKTIGVVVGRLLTKGRLSSTAAVSLNEISKAIKVSPEIAKELGMSIAEIDDLLKSPGAERALKLVYGGGVHGGKAQALKQVAENDSPEIAAMKRRQKGK